jgi:ATP-dependent protease HslVU (ClpYQ) peptidase subunit
MPHTFDVVSKSGGKPFRSRETIETTDTWETSRILRDLGATRAANKATTFFLLPSKGSVVTPHSSKFSFCLVVARRENAPIMAA